MVIGRFVLRVGHLINRSSLLINSNQINSVACISTSRCSFAERFYTDKHEWVQVEGKIGIIGISHYAQESLGDVVYAQLPDVDITVKQKDECGALESVKAASELYSPVSGRIVEKNVKVEEAPSLINSSCYEKGWLFKVELSNDKELTELMTEEQYQDYLKSGESH